MRDLLGHNWFQEKPTSSKIYPVVVPLFLDTIPVLHHCVLHMTHLIQKLCPCHVVAPGPVLYQLLSNITFETFGQRPYKKIVAIRK
jgi:hypothetical protein